MFDLLLVPAAWLLLLGLRAVRRGDPRPHSHRMAAGILLVGLRLALPMPFPARALGWGVFTLGAITLLVGRHALAWREGRNHRSGLPRLHRALGTLTLLALALAAVAWLLRRAF